MPNGSATSSVRSGTGDRPAARTTKKRISDEEWQMHKDNIERLYLDEGRDVREVRDTMKRDYGFDAHEKAYKRKFEEWGLIKNIPKEEGLFMVKKRERRREDEGKETIFRRRRRPDGPLQLVLDEKVDRIADRYSHDLNSYPEHPTTPDNIEYETPNGTPRNERHPPPNPQTLHRDHQPVRPQGSVATSNSDWAFAPITPMQPPPHHHDHTPHGYYVADQQNMIPQQHPHSHPPPLPLPLPLPHPHAHAHQQPHPHAHSAHQHPHPHPQHPQHPPNPQQHPPPPGGPPHSNWDPWSHSYF